MLDTAYQKEFVTCTRVVTSNIEKMRVLLPGIEKDGLAKSAKKASKRA